MNTLISSLITKTCTVVLFLAIISHTASAADKTNLLKNSDFKQIRGNGLPESWNVCSWLQKSCRKNAEGLTISINEAQNNYGYIAQTVKVSPGFIYRAGVSIKSSVNKIGFLQIKLFKEDKELKRITGGFSTVDKTEITKEFSTENADSIQFMIRLICSKQVLGETVDIFNTRLEATGIKSVVQPRSKKGESRKLDKEKTENLISDSSFEHADKFIPVYGMFGDYKQSEDSNLTSISTADKLHGKRSLELKPGGEWIFSVMDRKSDGAVLSAYIKGNGNSAANIRLEAINMDIHGGKMQPIEKIRNIKPVNKWQRCIVPLTIKKSTDQGLCRYTASIRNTGSGIVRLDAVQLELDRKSPSDYSSEKFSRMKFQLMQSYKLVTAKNVKDIKNKKDKTGKLTFTIKENAGSVRNMQPVWGGIPFPPDTLYHAGNIQLVDDKGAQIPVQAESLARRSRDGSIVSLLLNFQVSLKPFEKKSFTLKYGIVAASGELKKIASEGRGTIEINTGAVNAVIGTENFRLFDLIENRNGRITASIDNSGLFVESITGQYYSSANHRPEKIVVESNGPVSAVIAASGFHYDPTGLKKLKYEVRIRAFKDKPYFLIDYTFENSGGDRDEEINSIGIKLPFKASDGKYRIGLTDAREMYIPMDRTPFSVTQIHNRWQESLFELLLKEKDKPEQWLKKAKSDGTIIAENAAIAIRDFWKLAPKEIKVQKNIFTVYQWPKDGVKPVAVPFGASGTVRIFYAPLQADTSGMTLSSNPLHFDISPAWMASTGIFGDFMTRDAAAARYPNFARVSDNIFERIKRYHDVSDLYGMFDYGDFGDPSYYSNHETEGIKNLWLQYLISNNPYFYELACAASLHGRDVDTCHIRDGVAFRHTHSTGTHTPYHVHTGHLWLTGILWHYLLTGDKRSLDTAIATAAEMVVRDRIKYKGRERARMLFHLAELYELTGLVQFKTAMEKQYNHNQPTTIGASYYAGLGLSCVNKMYQVTGEKKYSDRLVSDANKIVDYLKKNPVEQGTAGIGQGRAWYLFRGLAEAADLTGNPAYIKAPQDYFAAYAATQTPADSCIVNGYEYLKMLDRFGVRENDLVPGNLFGINRLTGTMRDGTGANRFAFAIPVSSGRDFTIRIYKQRKFRYKRYPTKELSSITYSVLSPDGKDIVKGSIAGENEFGWKTIKVMTRKHGIYKLNLSFNYDCWGAVSCSSPMLLSSDRYFMCRVDNNVPISFWLKAPRSGDLTVDFKWLYSGNSYAGKILGASLEDVTGKLVDKKVWTIPLNWHENSTSDLNHKKLVLKIPENLRGKRLRIFIKDNKWLEWKITGLDYPWLANMPESIK